MALGYIYEKDLLMFYGVMRSFSCAFSPVYRGYLQGHVFLCLHLYIPDTRTAKQHRFRTRLLLRLLRL